jgi:hypothetical protein
VPQFDHLAFSNRTADKLQAVLNHDWTVADHNLPKGYLEACTRWFRSLTPSELLVAKSAIRFHASGNEMAAFKAARGLPPAPKFPISDDDD